jgi:hypothetical protein
MALASGDAVMPVGICQSRRAYLPASARAEGRLAWRGDYFVTIAPPLVFIGDADNHDLVREVSRQIRAAICRQVQASQRRMRETNLMQTPVWMPAGARAG